MNVHLGHVCWEISTSIFKADYFYWANFELSLSVLKTFLRATAFKLARLEKIWMFPLIIFPHPKVTTSEHKTTHIRCTDTYVHVSCCDIFRVVGSGRRCIKIMAIRYFCISVIYHVETAFFTFEKKKTHPT